MKWGSHTLIVFLLFAGCKPSTFDVPEKGVATDLASQRKEKLSNISYHLQLSIPSGKDEPIAGTIKLSFRHSLGKEPLILDFNTDSTKVLSVKAGNHPVPYRYTNEHIVIAEEYVTEGENELEIEFIAGDLSLNRNDDYLYTLFVPDRASTCFPLFDQPNLKATYQLTLEVPEDWEAVANGPLMEKKEVPGKATYHFGVTQPISSYLFAFAAGKFNKVTRKMNDRSMTMYYRETDSIKVKANENDIFQLHDRSIHWLEAYTSIEYPFGKFDFVLIPSFQYGGMEHPGAIFYNESSLFLDKTVSVTRRMGRASLIAHETAHMWFGDLVTMDWFNDVWMKEVFANFMAAKIVQPSFPEIDHNLRFLLSHYPGAYSVDRSAGANPILQPLDNLKNAGTLYGPIIYQKAPIVMRHLEQIIGEDQMRESLRQYLSKYAFGNARWDDLVSIMDAISPEDIMAWSNVWVKTAGMPEYIFEGKSIQQKRDSVSNRVWQQPLRIDRYDQWDTVVTFTSNDPIILSEDAQDLLLNTDGFSYGYFKMESTSKELFLKAPWTFGDPLMRASLWLNCWEGMLRGDGPSPESFVQYSLNGLTKEDNPLLIDFLLGNLQTVWWTFLPAHNRSLMQLHTEDLLWNRMQSTRDAGMKNAYFRAFRNIANSERSMQLLLSIWEKHMTVKDLNLSEEERIALACELALKLPDKQLAILQQQLSEIQNPDRKERLRFVMPALSDKIEVRNQFFESLKFEKNREHEPWVLEALGYLHHPLRTESSIGYLKPSLELLEEIQLTGDIFFPQRWLHTTFAGHNSAEALQIVNGFIANHPDYPPYLLNKILQATDMLHRSVDLNKIDQGKR